MWNGQDSPDSLYTQVFVKNAAGEKCEACMFENAYQAPAQPQVASMAQTGDMVGVAAMLIGLVALAAAIAAAIAYRRRSRE